MIHCCIFDLDGVIVDTAKYHLLAWQRLASELGFEFTQADGEATKGVSRMASLDIVLAVGGMQNRFTPSEKERMAADKNACYLEYIGQMTSAEILPGVEHFLHDLRANNVRVVLGSASKNAGVILDRCGIRPLFDAIVDGNVVSKAKPDPEVFAKGAILSGYAPAECVVFEDAEAGIEAATRAGMRSIGVGESDRLAKASARIATFEGFTFELLKEKLNEK